MKMISLSFHHLLLCWSLIGFTMIATADPAAPPPDPNDQLFGQGKDEVPEGAKVTLKTDRTEYLLGENVLVHFILENTGKEDFKGQMGGDYRGCDRRLRFKVTAMDDKNQLVPSPDPNPMCMGGLGGPITVKPGQKIDLCIPLTRYCQFDQPGTYIIHASHNFSWKEGVRKNPSGEITITFRMPTSEEAAQIVAKMEKESNDQKSVLMGTSENFDDFADFRCLRYPVYLKVLQPLAQSGDARALEAIGNLPSHEATHALIDLANGPSDSKQSIEAAKTLMLRLPDPEFTGKLPPRGPFNVYGTTKRQQLSAQSWDPSFVQPVRDLAKKYLFKGDKDSVAIGAFMVEAVGTADDAPLIFKATDDALGPLRGQPRRTTADNALDFKAPLPELVRAIQMLQARGLDSSHISGNDGAKLLAYFLGFVGKPGPRPDDWLQNLDDYGNDNAYPIAQTALASIPTPLPDNCVQFVERGLASQDAGVCRTACEIAEKSGHKEFLKPLLQIVQTENEEWLLRAAGSAGLQLGGNYEFWNVWADRLADENLFAIALDNLSASLEGLSGGTSGNTDLSREERLALKAAWKKFLSDHETELREGKKFKYTDPAVSPALFGRARQWDSLPNGKPPWPSHQ